MRWSFSLQKINNTMNRINWLASFFALWVCLMWEVKVSASEPMEVPLVTGNGKLLFEVYQVSNMLPEPAQEALPRAHGGFAVDRREGHGEVYFALPKAGIVKLSADLEEAELVETPEVMKGINLHNSCIWSFKDDPQTGVYLSFPSDSGNAVFTVDLNGKFLHTLGAPKPGDDLGDQIARDWFDKRKKFVPTDVDMANNFLYITTGYSDLDKVLTAKVVSVNPMKIEWYNLSFGGKGKEVHKFGTGHGITVSTNALHGKKGLAISDRPNSLVKKFSFQGNYEELTALPKGSLPCDIYYEGKYAIVGCLEGPDKKKGAPIYILEGGEVVSTLMIKEDLKMAHFTHVHNAVAKTIKDRLYIIAQAWNPGDFVILRQH